MLEGIHSINSSTQGLPIIIKSVVLIHAACILNDHTIATFIPPLSHSEMNRHWQNLVQQIESQKRLILICISRVKSRSSERNVESLFEGHAWPVLPSHDNEDDLEISGVISLSSPESQTGPFRGLVQKLFVSPFHRRKHIATNLLAELEKQALAMGRWSLMLDTMAGSPAEHMYPRLGYETLGVVKEYGFSPKDGSLVDEVFFWKDLRKATLLAE